MFTRRVMLLAASLWLLPISTAQAGAPALDETCRDPKGRPIPTQYESSSQAFAEVRPLPVSERQEAEEKGLSPFVIYINIERYYLGRQTQQWLYLRQCAHINEEHDIIRDGPKGLNIQDEESADCWAARTLAEEQPKVSSRTLYAIERDLERVIREDRWGEVLPGPQRRISLSSCLK